MKMNKKKWAAIVAGIIAVLTTILGLLNSGCSALRAKKLGDSIDNVKTASAIVCETAQVFADQGVDITGIDQCEKVVAVLTSDEMDAVVSIIECRESNEIKSPEFAECAIANGWPQIKKRIEQLSE